MHQIGKENGPKVQDKHRRRLNQVQCWELTQFEKSQDHPNRAQFKEMSGYPQPKCCEGDRDSCGKEEPHFRGPDEFPVIQSEEVHAEETLYSLAVSSQRDNPGYREKCPREENKSQKRNEICQISSIIPHRLQHELRRCIVVSLEKMICL
jgi:hypothetical protein